MSRLPWSEPEMMRAGHWAYITVPVLAVILVTNDFRHGSYGGLLGFVGHLAAVATAAWLWTMWCEIRVHGRKLCEQCAQDAPAAPQLTVARWKPALRLVHSPLPGMLLAALLLIQLPFIWHMTWLVYDLQGALMVPVVAFFVATRKHSVLQPWCPWCDWGHGGDEEVSPEVPDPEMSI